MECRMATTYAIKPVEHLKGLNQGVIGFPLKGRFLTGIDQLRPGLGLQRRVYETMHIDEIEDILKGPPRILFVVAEKGNARFIVEVLKTYPDLMFDKNEDGLTVFHIAVTHRHQGIYNLMYEIAIYA
ncbi:hypothetical protein Tco_0870520 [Tanacetum coccineum]